MSGAPFAPAPSRVNLPALEDDILAFWDKEDIFKKSLDATRENEAYVFYDGPPFATGLPHYGHLTAGTLKDIIPRYWTMRGRCVDRRFGWDCHGLPVENEMEKEFNVSGKRDIEKIGVHIFNEACRSIVLRYTGEWKHVVLRMGRWVDLANQYRTMDPPYMESIWWVFKQVWDRDLLYRGYRVQPYCPRCATPLSNFEVNEGYRDVKGPSITVTFPLADDPDTSILVWTTTPWTLPSNVALAVGADITYVTVRDGDRRYILAKDRLGAYYRSEDDYTIEKEFSGTELAGKRYRPLFEFFTDASPDFFQITEAGFVSTEDGTGIVHIAPAFGEDDFEVGKKLGLPVVCPVDEEGRFTEDVAPWQGKLVFDADEEITQTVKKAGRLVHRGTIEHRYPHCYRCDTPLIYKTIDTWFMKIEPLKKNMLENNGRIHWVPDHLRDGRFGKGVESAPDWNISRNRYWGTPIPVWQCECGHSECVGSLEQLHTLMGAGDRDKGKKRHAETVSRVGQSVKEEAETRLAEFKVDAAWARKIGATEIDENDIHRHIVDECDLICPVCGQIMVRTPEVLDCWFESGSMPYAQNHYPFERAESFERNFPADFIAEGLDQTRGWFYTLTVLASALFQKEAFRNVVVNGIILAEDGKKLSKRLRNYADPVDVLNGLGADALRLFLINSPAVKAEDLRFSERGVSEMSRAVLLPFWNAYSFFVTYANVDTWTPAGPDAPASENELDRWIVSLLNDTIRRVNEQMERYNLYRVVPVLVDFIDNLTNWYIRRSRRRFWKSENDADKTNAYATLYHVLLTFSKVMAPFLPFMTETIYRNLTSVLPEGSCVSVHLCPFPAADNECIDEELEEKMDLTRQAVTMARALRSRFQIKIRQPLAQMSVVIRSDHKRALLSSMAELIADELNVKQVVFDTDEHALVDVFAKPNYKKLGKVFGPKMRDAAKQIEALSADEIAGLENGSAVTIEGHAVTIGDLEFRRVKHAGIEVETEGEITVALNTDITDELRREGMAREFVNRIQNLRKSSDFDVTDRIAISCVCEDQTLRDAVCAHQDYICAETLATDFACDTAVEGGHHDIDIDGMTAHVSIARSSA